MWKPNSIWHNQCFCFANIALWRKKLFRQKERILCIGIIIIGDVVSLQKASVINLIILLIFYFLRSFKRGKIKFITYFLIGIIAFVIFFFSIRDTALGKYIDATINFSISSSNQDGGDSTTKDLIQRLTTLPYTAYINNEVQWYHLLFGKGLPMYAGTVGLTNYSMCHNNYITMIFSGGILYLIGFLSLFISKITKGTNFEKMVCLIYFINMTIGGAEFFQPVMGVFIFCFLLIRKK